MQIRFLRHSNGGSNHSNGDSDVIEAGLMSHSNGGSDVIVAGLVMS